MRRKDREITDFNEIINIIKKCDVCRIALNDKDFPQYCSTQLWIGYPGKRSIFIFSLCHGRKKIRLDCER